MNNFIGEGAADQLPEGLHELLNTDALGKLLNESELQPIFEDIDIEDTADALSRHIATAVRQAIAEA
ncbi:hypothetical protein [Arthrobacter sp. FW306-2-2C-D06B]|uniref:hypothetical protein n=1 Tax=Arthrobacter sp. FW306-2-2C-D06B TaxID=2879618 RepID=UPI001F19B10F|nr:hypothetical protein [Arthrobacter sp. FW306-2-2C-D06B]UKA59778.1 hypothetical protein LFT47_05390 [Arthrobacter sp. FW306-2-2C-D06B]